MATLTRIGFALTAAASLACSGSSSRGAAAGRTAASSTTDSAKGSDSTAPRKLVLTSRGLGPLALGMSAAEAAAAVGIVLSPNDTSDAKCYFGSWRGAPPGVSFMLEKDRVVRIDVDSASVATEEGIRVGDNAARIRGMYGPRVSTMPHKYETGGRYYIIAPVTGRMDAPRFVFETNADTITRFRVGLLPAVQYVERCG